MPARGAALATVVAGMALLAGAGGASAAEIPESGTLDLAAQSDVRMNGPEEGSRAGFSVARAGDVNGDGLADMLVGAPNADPGGRANAGSAYVIFGQREKAPIDLADLGGSGFRMDGPTAGDHAGFSVSAAGDLNGDGRADLIVGAPAPGQDRPGAAYVVYGKADAGAVLLGAAGPGGYRIGGGQSGDYAGFSVGSVGDLNGDGRPELLVGAPRVDVNADDRDDSGAVYVVYGNGSATDADLTSLGSGGYRIAGEDHGFAGWSVDGSPDMNGDGLPEVLVGAPFVDTPPVPGAPDPSGGPTVDRDGIARTGAAYVVFGKAGTAEVDLAALGSGGFRMTGGQGRGPAAGSEDLRNADEGETEEVARDRSGEAAGSSVASVGDVNGDGLPDVAVGAVLADRGSRLNAGSVYVVHGKASADGVTLADVGGANGGAAGFRIDGGARGDLMGTSVSSAGDVNGDGRRDLLVTAPFADAFAREEGGANYLLYGQETERSYDLASIGDGGFRIAGPGPGDRASRQAAGVGDVNGDGAPDLLMGSALAREKPACAPEKSEEPCEEETPDEPERGPRLGAAFVVYSPTPAPPPPPDPGQEEEEEAGCTAVRNVEVIVDDSGSMGETDPEELRRRAIELLLQKPRNEGDVLGALEFGSEAFELFAPEAIDDEKNPDLIQLLKETIDADDGGTNYNAAFEIVSDENPTAGARIFLTDGGHNEGEYVGGHAGGPPTYVIGLDIGRRGPDARRLQRIADDTGGRYFPNVDDDELQPVLGRIDSLLNCDTSVEDFEDTVDDESDEEEYVEDLDEGTYSSDITLSWDDATDDLDVERVTFQRRGHGKVAVGRRKIRKALRTGRTVRSGRLRLKARGGTTYQALRVSGLRRGKLRFRVGVSELKGKSRLTAQVAQSRRRR